MIEKLFLGKQYDSALKSKFLLFETCRYSNALGKYSLAREELEAGLKLWYGIDSADKTFSKIFFLAYRISVIINS